MVQPRNSKRNGFCLPAFLTVTVVLLTCSHVYGQATGATVSGTVTDSSGSTIAGAQISIQNVATGVGKTSPTNSDGFYTVPNLLPGSYELKASAAGFATDVRTGITLTVGAQQVLNLTLTLGRTNQTIQVTGEAPSVDLTSSAISAVVSSHTVIELPLNGRSWTDLTTLQPGVNVIPTRPDQVTAGSDRANRGYGDQLTISGGRPVQNNYRLDGISMNDYANAGPGSVLGGNLGVDAIQEFSVLTTNYSAEYGKTSGGVVNAISRSGTNQFHGDAYEFFRNSALDARSFFDPAKIPPFRRNQYGASAGGPIQKGRTFVFGDYEGIRQSKGISFLSLVPSQAAHNGNLCSVPSSSACTPTTVTVDPSAQKYLPLFPLPNGGLAPGGNGDTGLFTFSGNVVVDENFFTARLDHKFSEKDSVFVSYLFDRAIFQSPDQLDTVRSANFTFRQLATVEETHIFSPKLVNIVRFGYNRESAYGGVAVSAINPVAADPSLSTFPGRDAAQVFFGGGLASFSGGADPNSGWHFNGWNSFQVYDDASLTVGTHSLKFGVAAERMQLNMFTGGSGGRFNFPTLLSFLTNRPSKFTAGPAPPLVATPRGFRQTLFGGYLQDDWHLRPNLTLNLGVRYEPITIITEAQGKLANLINLTDSAPHLGSPFMSNPTLRNFEPRVGFAWDPFSNGKTAVRGGFGMFDVLPMIYEFMIDQNLDAPFAEKSIVSKGLAGTFPSGVLPLLKPTALTSEFVEQHPHRSYVMQWNLNVQRQVAPTLTAMVGYVGSRGVHLPFRGDTLNMVLPTLTSAGYLWPAPIGSGTELNPTFGQIQGYFFEGNSFYDALQTSVSKRMSHGFQLQTSFTWAKSIDTSSTSIQGDQFGNSVSSLLWFAPNLSRAVSDFNVARTFVINGIWQPPTVKSLSGPVAWLANGWELGIIFTLSDGVPFTPTWGTGSDPSGTGMTDDYAFPNRLTGPGCATLVNPGNPNNYIKTQCFTLPMAPDMAFWQANCDTTSNIYGPNLTTVPFPVCFNLRGNAGRNILPGPGLENLNFSVFKNNYLKRVSESFNVQFRAELFNILNHPNFQPNHTANAEADVFDASGSPVGTVGKLLRTSTDAREIQFAVKFIW
jgi:outer membrane receptor protein involved in Fe transport